MQACPEHLIGRHWHLLTNWRPFVLWSPEQWVSPCYAIKCDRSFYCALFCVVMTCVSPYPISLCSEHPILVGMCPEWMIILVIVFFSQWSTQVFKHFHFSYYLMLFVSLSFMYIYYRQNFTMSRVVREACCAISIADIVTYAYEYSQHTDFWILMQKYWCIRGKLLTFLKYQYRVCNLYDYM
jgi:hypothetical protein